MTTLREAAQRALKALESNDKWHQDYDDHGIYPGSELHCENTRSIVALRDALASEPQAEPVCWRYDSYQGIPGGPHWVYVDNLPDHESKLVHYPLYAGAPPVEQPGAVGLSEREAFEAEMRCEDVWGHRSFKRDHHGADYANHLVQFAWEVWQARAALAAAQPAALGRSQHDADSAELRILCQARDEARRHRDALLAELAGHETAGGHLSALVDDLRRLLYEAMRVMKTLHEAATPDGGPAMDAIIPAGAFRQFVDDNARLMHLIRISPHNGMLPAEQEWVSVDASLPPSGKAVIAFIPADPGKKNYRRIRAIYASPMTLEMDPDQDSGEYDETTDTYYCPEGWYEANLNEERHWRVTDQISHWMHMPAPPSIAATKGPKT